MKTLINSPLNIMFSVIGLMFILMMIWNLIKIQQLSISEQQLAAQVPTIPSTETLAVPPLRNYKTMLDTPLFWESRSKYAPPKQVVQIAAPIVDKTLPKGRLTGIVDTGDKRIAVFHDDTNKSQYLHLGEYWGQWKINQIHASAVEVNLNNTTQTIKLVSDYKAPSANNSQPVRNQAMAVRSNNALTESRRAKLPTTAKGLPHVASTEKQAPPLALPAAMNIKDALKTRQRLMAARWQKRK
jgi:hypothetical protein